MPEAFGRRNMGSLELSRCYGATSCDGRRSYERAAVAEMSRVVPELALIAGGKSFGGRMTSQAQPASPLPGVRGFVFLGFPLHPPGMPSNERGKHLFGVQLPMLFLQGGRDQLANPQLLEQLVEQLGARATLVLFPDADHSFHVPAHKGGKDSEIRAKS